MKFTVDAMGDACPIPVIKTKKALGEAVSHLKNPIWPDAADGNRLLYGPGNLKLFPVQFDGSAQCFEYRHSSLKSSR